MMFYDTPACGQRNRPVQPNGAKQSAQLKRAAVRLVCSERVKTGLLEQYRPSGAKTEMYLRGHYDKQ